MQGRLGFKSTNGRFSRPQRGASDKSASEAEKQHHLPKAMIFALGKLHQRKSFGAEPKPEPLRPERFFELHNIGSARDLKAAPHKLCDYLAAKNGASSGQVRGKLRPLRTATTNQPSR